MANSLDQLDLSNIIGPYFNSGLQSSCGTVGDNYFDQHTCLTERAPDWKQHKLENPPIVEFASITVNQPLKEATDSLPKQKTEAEKKTEYEHYSRNPSRNQPQYQKTVDPRSSHKTLNDSPDLNGVMRQESCMEFERLINDFSMCSVKDGGVGDLPRRPQGTQELMPANFDNQTEKV